MHFQTTFSSQCLVFIPLLEVQDILSHTNIWMAALVIFSSAEVLSILIAAMQIKKKKNVILNTECIHAMAKPQQSRAAEVIGINRAKQWE